jgi:DNA-binding response OmpR family regulator
MRILAVEDEPAIVRMLERGLSAYGHQVIPAKTGEDAIAAAGDEGVELVLLDIALPGIDGHEVLAQIRARRPGLPVLMLTARDDIGHKLRALDAGADDYLTKPFAFDELLARIRAVARRTNPQQAAQLEAGDLRLDLLGRRAWRGKRLVELSAREFALLEYLMRHPYQVVSRAQILAAVWASDYEPGSNVVDVYVRYLRRKLCPADEPCPISTVRGSGYRFDPDTGSH